MSFWDLEESTSPLQNILKNEPNNLKAILESPELIQSFRVKDEELMKVLLDPKIIHSLIEIVFSSSETKLAKKAFELFIAKPSPLLPILINNQQNLELCLNSISSNDYVRIGYATRIFDNLFEEEKENTLKYFNTSSKVLSILFLNSNKSAVLELIDTYIKNASLQNCWFIWSLFILLAQKECSECPNAWKQSPYLDFANFLGRNLANTASSSHLQTLVQVIIDFINEKNLKETNKELMQTFSSFLPSMINNKMVTEKALELSLLLPRNDQLVPIAKQLTLSKVVDISVLSLKLLTQYLQEKEIPIEDSYQQFASKFIAEPSNSLYACQYIEFLKALCKYSLYNKKTIDTFASYIIQHASKEKWRSSVLSVGYLLDIALIIDPSISNNAEWERLRQNEIELWKHKEDDTPKDTFEPTGLTLAQRMAASEGIVLDQNKTNQPPKAATAQQNNEIQQLKFGADIQSSQPQVLTQSTQQTLQEKANSTPQIQQQPQQTVQVPKPKIPAPFTPPTNIPPKKGAMEVSVENFFKLINDPYWNYTGLPPEQIFHVKESFDSADDAFAFLVKQ